MSVQVVAGGFGNFIKQLDSSITTQKEDAESSDDPTSINKKELKSTIVLDENGPNILLKLDFTNTNDQYKAILLSYVKDGDLCIGTSSVRNLNYHLSSDKSLVTDLKPNEGDELVNRFEPNEHEDGKYTVTMMRPDGSCYRLSSGVGFLRGTRAIPVNTPKGDQQMIKLKAEKEAAAIAAKQTEDKAASDAKAVEDAFQAYIKPTDIEAASYQKLLNDAKSRGDLVFKNFFLGMPIGYFASQKNMSLGYYKKPNPLFGVEGPKFYEYLKVNMGNSKIYLKQFDDQNPYRVENGVYYYGKTPIKELGVDMITLDREALESLFGVADLESVEIIKKFCEGYKISVPDLWIPEREIMQFSPGNVQSIYKLRDSRGFRLTFTCSDKERGCDLVLEKIKTDKDIDKSFN